MNQPITALAGLIFMISSCSKSEIPVNQQEDPGKTFTQYRIPRDQHYSEKSTFTPINTDALHFKVKFDSSAIYTTKIPANQADINKLYGFADNDAHHQLYSARIGWRWSDSKLRLFAYVYNNAVLNYEEIAVVSIGEEHNCSIKIFPGSYTFSVNGFSKIMPRESKTLTAKGYKLFPYFGGDETAPHDISIWISEK